MQAQPISFGEHIRGTFSSADDLDIYSFVLTGNTNDRSLIMITVSGMQKYDIHYAVYKDTQLIRYRNFYSYKSSTDWQQAESLKYLYLAPGNYYIIIGADIPKTNTTIIADSHNTDTQYYDLSVTLTTTKNFIDEQEPNDTREYAMPVSVGTTVSAYINAGTMYTPRLEPTPTDNDWYKLEIPVSNVFIEVLITGVPNCDPVVEAFGEHLEYYYVNDAAQGKPERINAISIPQPTTLYIHVKQTNNAENLMLPYRISFTLKPPPPGYEIEPNNSPATATKLYTAHEIRGYFNSTHDIDTYHFIINRNRSPQLFSAWLEPFQGANIRLTLKNENGSNILIGDHLGTGRGEYLMPMLLNNGEYYLTIEDKKHAYAGTTIPYLLHMTITNYNNDHELEPNDIASQATTLILDRPMNGLLFPENDSDIFCVQLLKQPHMKRYALEIELSGITRINTTLMLQRESDSESKYTLSLIDIIDKNGEGKGESARIPCTPGYYFFMVYGIPHPPLCYDDSHYTITVRLVDTNALE